MAVKRTMYQRKVDVDMLNAVKSMLAEVSSNSRLCFGVAELNVNYRR